MRNFLASVNILDSISRFNQQRQSSMHSEDVIHIGCDGKIKYISKELPNYSVFIFVLTLHIETIILSSRSQLMIAPNQQHFCWVFQLQQTEQGLLFKHWLLINVVSKKEIVSIRQLSSYFEYLKNIKKLSMRFAYHYYGIPLSLWHSI